MPMKEPTMAPGMMRLKSGIVVSTSSHEDDTEIDNDLLTGFCAINMFLCCGTMIGSAYVAWASGELAAPVGMAVIFFGAMLNGLFGVYSSYKKILAYRFYFLFGLIFLFPVICVALTATYSTTNITEAYVNHSWPTQYLETLREWYCPADTADGACAAPIYGGPDYANIDDWCIAGCPDAEDNNALQCDLFTLGCSRDVTVAQTDAEGWLNENLEALASMAMCVILCMIPIMYMTMRIVDPKELMAMSIRVVSYESLMPALCLLIAGSFLASVSEFQSGTEYIAAIMCVCAILVPILAFLGIQAEKARSRNYFVLYMIGTSIVCTLLMVCFISAWSFSENMGTTYSGMSSKELSEVPCGLELEGCCCCDQSPLTQTSFDDDDGGLSKCPEWSADDLAQLAIMNLRVVGLVAFLMLFFQLAGVLSAYYWYKLLGESTWGSAEI